MSSFLLKLGVGGDERTLTSTDRHFLARLLSPRLLPYLESDVTGFEIRRAVTCANPELIDLGSVVAPLVSGTDSYGSVSEAKRSRAAVSAGFLAEHVPVPAQSYGSLPYIYLIPRRYFHITIPRLGHVLVTVVTIRRRRAMFIGKIGCYTPHMRVPKP